MTQPAATCTAVHPTHGFYCDRTTPHTATHWYARIDFAHTGGEPIATTWPVLWTEARRVA